MAKISWKGKNSGQVYPESRWYLKINGEEPMPGYNVPDDYGEWSNNEFGNWISRFELMNRSNKMPRRRKQYKRARSFRRKKRGGLFSLTVRKGRKIWRMVRKFKSKASRDRAKRGLRSVGWR